MSRTNNTTRTETDGAMAAHLTYYGGLIFNQPAVERFDLQTATRCRLYFERTRQRIAVEIVPDCRETAMDRGTRRVYTTANSAHVMIASVLRTYGLVTAADIPCPVEFEHYDTMDLISVDVTPALRAAERARTDELGTPRTNPDSGV